MRQALLYILVWAAYCTASSAAEQKSWNKIRYVGGTIPVKPSPYDWNTTLTVAANSDFIVLVIAPSRMFAPRQTVRIQFSQVLSLSYGPSAWRRVSEVPGAQFFSKPPTLFGLMENHGLLGIVYFVDDGKRGAVLLDSYFSWSILSVLETLTGKQAGRAP
ncbi:MAG TPA: hypothetical protein VG672_03710 [Bryobacteraceae bacterium]|jgi:hypothetical protein|nr:hypothetical protein [Bryobacteraceae bacterium]